MKKLLVLTLAMLFIGVGIASAASKLTMSGNYYVKGTWYDNMDGTATAEPIESFGVTDHEMTLDMVFAMTPYTKVAARLELRDEVWGVTAGNGAVSGGTTEGAFGSDPQSNIVVEELYGQHVFMNHSFVKVGLMKTSTWASDFSNNSVEAFRLMYLFPTPVGTAFVFTEKPQVATGKETLVLDQDSDNYVAALFTKIGSVNFLPLVAYLDYEGNPGLIFNVAYPATDFELWSLDLGFNGTINNVGWEAEIIYQDWNYENETIPAVSGDYNPYGMYFSAWTQMDALKLGAYVGYGSYDKDVNKGFAFGDDFDGSDGLAHGKLMMLGDEVDFGVSAATIIDSATVGVLYGVYNMNEKLSVSLLGAYADSNVDLNGARMNGATAVEIDIIGQYKITPLLTYSAGAAFCDVETEGAFADPDAAIEISHMLSFDF